RATRRPRGIALQARGRRQGQLSPHPRARRRARSRRQPPLRAAGGLPPARSPASARAHAVTVRRGVAILGSTGSVGTTALRVLERQADRFAVTALTAGSNAALLREQAVRFAPAF